MSPTWDWGFAWSILPQLADGLWITVKATLAGISVALALGLVLAMARRSRNFLISYPTAALIEFVRSTPLLVQLYFLFFVLPNFGITLSAFQTGVIGLGLHYGAYTSEVYRSGIEGVPRGQWEASSALSLGPRTTWVNVVLPQVWPRVLPALGNYLIAMFKDAPLLSAITVVELLQQGKIVCNELFRCLEPFTLVGVLFLAVSVPASILVHRLEERLGRSHIFA
ncbi:MAG: ectoine/hydroxyectoine ABC transporter permease subunit EhuD [Dehalococcoidia bacterium]